MALVGPSSSPAESSRSGVATTKLGLVGCGNVSGDYLQSARMHPDLEVASCADVDRAAAEGQAERYGVPSVREPTEIITDPTIDLIINLTPPAVHSDITFEAIAAGKHVYSEKPLAQTLDVAEGILAAAQAAGVSIGCAPATFLGGGLQTCRKIIDDGWIGTPVAATAFFTSRGYEHWHPHVDSFYSPGGGPLLDIGPYSITALVHLLGPAVRVCASTRRASATRRRPEDLQGVPDIPVNVSTHAAGTIDFACGATATVITSWEMWATRLPYMEVYGTVGTLGGPNPDEFFGTPAVRRGEPGDLAQAPTPPCGGAWYDVAMTHSGEVGRAVGVAEMVDALRNGRSARASAQLAYHVLEILLAFDKSSTEGSHIDIDSTCDRPMPLPPVAAGEPVRFTAPDLTEAGTRC